VPLPGSARLAGAGAQQIQRDRQRKEQRGYHRKMTRLRGGQAEIVLGEIGEHDRCVGGDADRDGDAPEIGLAVGLIVQGGTTSLREWCSAAHLHRL